MTTYVECGEQDDPVLGGGYHRVCRRQLHHPFPCSEVPDPPEPETPAALPPVEVDEDEMPPVGEVLPFEAPPFARGTVRRLFGRHVTIAAGRRRAL